MKEEKNLIVTLDNNKKYALVNSILFNEKKYVYLAELEDYKNIIIGEMENEEITVVDDNELFGQLIMEFNKII
jgi:hypothetical protein